MSALRISVIFLLATLGLAQEFRATLLGSVTDPSGAGVPGAKVIAVNIETSVRSSTETDGEGNYLLAFLAPGRYRLRVEHSGFMAHERSPIELRVSDRVRVDVQLAVGVATQSVTVTEPLPLLETESANLGRVYSARQFTDLPLSHGTPYVVLYLTPGVTTSSGPEAYAHPAGAQIHTAVANIQGAPMGSTDFTMDGVPNTQNAVTSWGQGANQSPPADIVTEIKIETAFDASVGHTSGTIVNVNTKSGTNEVHGSAYYNTRRPEWNANSFFNNRSGLPRPVFDYRRWGGSFTGPVWLPRIYKGKDRTFFAAAFEELKENSPIRYFATVPTAEQLQGDFSGLLRLGPQYQIYDPASAVPAPGGRLSRQPFAGNRIPASRISPIGLNIARLYPQPNAPGAADGTGNFDVGDVATPFRLRNWVFRVDHAVSERQRIFGRFGFSTRDTFPRRPWDQRVYGAAYHGPNRQFALDHVYSLRPNLILNARYGYNRFAGRRVPDHWGFNVRALGFPEETLAQITEIGQILPRIDVSALPPIGFEAASFAISDSHSGFLTLTKQQGKHNLKAGIDARAYRNFNRYYGMAAGYFLFDTAYTRGPLDSSPGSPNGLAQGLAALLLGQPSSGFIDRNTSEAITMTYWAGFLHDNWRVRQGLTVDVGLRWEYEGPLTERFNRAVRGFDPNANLVIRSQALAAYAAKPDPALPVNQFQVRGGVQFAGVGGVPRLFWDRYLGGFHPRIGIALQPHKRLVLRSGFGIFGGFGFRPVYLGAGTQGSIQTGFSQQTPFVASTDGGLTFIGTLARPFPSGLLPASGASLGPNTYLGRGLEFYDPIASAPYSTKWDFNIQVQMPAQTLIEIGYMGNKAIKLMTRREMNGIPLQYLSSSPFRDQETINFLTAQVPNPFVGLLPGTGLNGATIARNQLLRPYPHFTSVIIRDHQGHSWYHALHFRADRRMNRGIGVQFSYTFSKAMEALGYLNAADPRPFRGLSWNDRPHALSLSGIFELPIGRGRAVLGSAGRGLDLLVGGWQAGAIWRAASGTLARWGNVLFAGNPNDIPIPAAQRRVERWFNADAGFERAAARQLDYNIRSWPLCLSSIRGGPLNRWDITLAKRFRISESTALEFRTDFLNAFNHPSMFNDPVVTPTDARFGTVVGQTDTPRYVQMGLKLVF